MCQTDDKNLRSFTMLDPYEIEELVGKSSKTADNNPFELHPFGSTNFECAAMRFCRDTDHVDITSEKVLCINYNRLAHLYCLENFIEQSPVELDYVVKYTDLGFSGKTASDEFNKLISCLTSIPGPIPELS